MWTCPEKGQRDRREEEGTEKLRRFTVWEPARGFYLFEEAQNWNVDWDMQVAAAVLDATVRLCHLSWDKKSSFSDTIGSFSRGWVELNPARNQNLCHQHQEWVKLQLALCLLLLTILRSTISHLLPLLQRATLLACSLDASPCMPAIVLYYWTFQGTVL